MLYLLDARAELPNRESAQYASIRTHSWDQWHRLYGHISVNAIKSLKLNQMVDGLKIDESTFPSESCEACIQAKQAHKPFPQEAKNRSELPGERIMSDVWGPAQTESIGRWKYYISFTDDGVRLTAVLFLKKKGQAFDRIKEYVAVIERKFGKPPKFMRFDNGKELVNEKLRNWAAEKGITIETSAPYSPSQNGVAERFNRTLLELARAMIIAKNLPVFLWDEAVMNAAYLRNRAPTRALNGKTPYEAWTGNKPDVSHFREFGCNVWVLDETKNRSKLAPKSNKFIFVGFHDGSKSVRYYDAKTRTIKVSRNVAFNENEEPRELEINANLPGLRVEGEPEEKSNAQTSQEIENTLNPIPTTIPTQEIPSPIEPINFPALRPRRTRTDHDYRRLNNPQARPTDRTLEESTPPDITRHTESSAAKIISKNRTHLAFEDFIGNIKEKSFQVLPSISDKDGLPETLEEAMQTEEKEHWMAAVEAELNVLEKMGTWKMEDLPVGREPIGCRWVFDKKRDEHGNIVKYKARLVAQGFSQKPGTDFSHNGTFAPVMRFETLRTMLALAAVNKWDMRQLDVKSAYLNGKLTEEIYMKQPPGFSDSSGRVCRLKRALYGLKQAGHAWNREFNGAMENMGFMQLKTDYCCYIRREGEKFAILLVWVDDILTLTNSPAESDRVEAELKSKYDIKALGQPSLLLGMKVTHDTTNHTITLSQTHYIDKLLKKFNLENLNPVTTPLDPNVDLNQDDEPSDDDITHDTRGSGMYETMIGSLMYAALGTRPDIAYATNRLAQFTSRPQPKHWTAVKRIFRYLKGTRNYALTYGGTNSNADINIYCDADWASHADRKSVSGYVVTIAGGAVAWSSKKQNTVALSTAEAEYISATHTAKQVLWHRSLFNELEIPQPKTSTIFTDNQAAISIGHNPEFHARTKHIDIALHFLRDHVEKGNLDLIYISTHNNLADLFTKGLPRIVHQDLTYEIGVIPDQGGVLE